MKYFLLFFLMPLCAAAQIQPDSSVSAGIINRFEAYVSSHQTEKVYLHFDRPYYAAGDTLFFKAYVTLGNLHKLSALSGVLHAELIDNITGKIILSEKLPVVSGVACGDFALPDSLHNNSYRIRAYTRLMLNNELNLFEQNISIVSVAKPNTFRSAIQNKNLKPDIQFFPEGGRLVNGINSKIAFKAVAANGLGIAVSGRVTDNENNTVATFKAEHLGMGYFNYTPEKGMICTAKVFYANGAYSTVNLPVAGEDGLTLSVDNNYANAIAQVKIFADKSTFATHKGQSYMLSVYTNGQLTNITCKLDSQVILMNLFKWKIHSGITKLTLFSPDGEPLCERLMFVLNSDMLKLNVSSDKVVYEAREKVSIRLGAADNKEQPVEGNFSVSVTDESKVPVDNNSESTILNNLLLTSELTGNIEEPNYYFSQNANAYKDLDILLLTQGYRDFQWKTVLKDTNKIVKYKPEISLEVAGTVKTPGGKLSPGDDINLVSTKPYITRDTTTDNTGKFIFYGINVIDTDKLLLRAKGNRVINITETYKPLITKNVVADSANSQIAPGLAAEMIKRYYQQGGSLKKGFLLKQVNVHDARGEHPFSPKLLHSDNLNGPGEADQTVLVDDYIGYPTLRDLLAIATHAHRPALGNQPMVVVLGGVAISVNDVNLNPLENIPVSDIYSIELLYSPSYLAVYGSKATGGAIVVTLRNGSEMNSVSVQPGLTTYKFMGFYKSRVFYSPKYDVKTTTNKIPDYRTTIYWNPVLLTDKDGNASFDFYNTDAPGNYRMVIEGIDGNGNLGRQVYHYAVQ